MFKYFKILIHNTKKKNKLIKIAKKKEKIKVAFFVINKVTFSYEKIYELMLNDDLFCPVLVVIPMTSYGLELMIKSNKEVYDHLVSKGYKNVIKTYDDNKKEIIEFKKFFDPDIIIYNHPYKSTTDEYYIKNNKDKITYYLPYGFCIANLQNAHYNLPFHNLVDGYFCETYINHQIAKKVSDIKACNLIVTGLPQSDVFLEKNYKAKNVWKKQKKIKKKIIWAPHHSIEDNDDFLGYSNFLNYSDKFIEISKKYIDILQIAFKPHPSLHAKLSAHKDWGKIKTDNYYKKWKEMENTQIEQKNYVDLFITSDAIIMDSISFILEYMFVNKPSLFMLKDGNTQSKFNILGKLAFETLYKSSSEEDIIDFIENQVLKEIDPLKRQRSKFAKEYLVPPNGKNASENIYNHIRKELKK